MMLLLTLQPQIIALALTLASPLDVKAIVLEETSFLPVELVCTSENEMVVTIENYKGISQKLYFKYARGKLRKIAVFTKVPEHDWKSEGSIESDHPLSASDKATFDRAFKFSISIFQKVCHGSLSMKRRYKNYMSSNRRDLELGYYDDEDNRESDPTVEQ